MIVTTTDTVPGRPAKEILGIVKGTTVRARHLGRHLLAVLRGMVGGEVNEYTKVIAEAREQSYDRMLEDARSLGADAILGMRFQSAEVMRNAAEIIVYGTAVMLMDEETEETEET